jgi:hypothetical protein
MQSSPARPAVAGCLPSRARHPRPTEPLGRKVIGPIAVAIGASEPLAVAGALSIAVCIGIVLVPSVRSLRNDTSPVAAMTEPAP